MNSSPLIDCSVSKIVEKFFAIPESRIAQDLRNLKREDGALRKVFAKEEQSLKRPRKVIGPRRIAESAHRQLLLGYYFLRCSDRPYDLGLFAASLPAAMIAEFACAAACRGGRLLELEAILEPYVADAKPLDAAYQKAAYESDQLLDSIRDTIFSSALERYELCDLAEKFEGNRPIYEVSSEVGRCLVQLGDLDRKDKECTAARFRERYGPEVALEFTRRLDAHGILVA